MALVQVSKLAWKKMGSILQSTPSSGFLFQVISGGCNGFNFNLSLLDSHTLSTLNNPARVSSNNIHLYVDPGSEMFLIGSSIDYVVENIERGQFENKFIFTIDNKLASSCGCGISFSPKSF